MSPSAPQGDEDLRRKESDEIRFHPVHRTVYGLRDIQPTQNLR
jgi:hypothetical protein